MGSIQVNLDPAWVYGLLSYLIGIIGWAIRVEMKLAMLNKDTRTIEDKLMLLQKSEDGKTEILRDIRERIVRIETKLEEKHA